MRILYHELRKAGKRKRIALLMGLSDTYEHGIARGVVRYAKGRRDWDLYGYGWMFRPFDALEVWRGDGIIARIESPEQARLVARLPAPVVDVAGAYPVKGFAAVTNDDVLTGRRAGEYLLSCGFHRFAYCGVAGTGWSTRRYAGFRDAVRHVDPAPAIFEEPLPWWETIDTTGRLGGWIKALRRPVGVFAANDTAGMKLADLCRDQGVAVPETLAILGVDNEDILCEMTSPTLSSIELDCETIGYRAAEALEGLMNGGRAASAARFLSVAPKEVIERESTRVFASEDPLVEKAMRYIHRFGTGRLTVGGILAAVPASRRSLETRFKKVTGRTLRAEIVRVRLARARALLRTTNLTVGDVAAECGFGSAQRFHEAFRQAEGASPGRFRRDASRGIAKAPGGASRGIATAPGGASRGIATAPGGASRGIATAPGGASRGIATAPGGARRP
jgi:LacI family transcriptional regulator